jgi:hypothetical protein
MLRDVATRAEHAAKRQEKRRAAAIPQASYTITCPSCSHEWNTLKVGRRARTCPSCGHVGPREAFAERLTATTNGSIPAGPPAEEAIVAKLKSNGEDHKVKPKLAGAAAAAHAAKERGEPVTVGNAGRLHGMKRARSASSSSSSATTTRMPAKPVGILERLKRAVI